MTTGSTAKVYKVSAWVKANALQVRDGYNNYNGILELGLYSNDVGGFGEIFPAASIKDVGTQSPLTFDWAYFELYAWRPAVAAGSGADPVFKITAQAKSGDVWISDVKVEEVAVASVGTGATVVSDLLDKVAKPAESVTLTFGVVSTGGVSYSWSKNGNSISGALSASLCIPNVSVVDEGVYTCTAYSRSGQVTSRAATLSVFRAPTIVFPVADRVAIAGGNLSLSVGASAYPIATYQWLKNGVAIAGATNSVLQLTSVSSEDAGKYTVVVTNSVGSTTSSAAAVTVNVPPAITSQPAGVIVNAGQIGVFSVVAGGVPTPSYQWRKNGLNIPGATSPTLTVTGARGIDAGSYDVVVTNSAGSVTSVSATLTVNLPPTITTSPQNQGVLAGGKVSFSVTASSTLPLTYQWTKDGSAIPGATTAALTIDKALPSDAGSYTVLITNAAGSVTSTGGTLTVAFSRLVNLSILASIESSGDTFTMGYVLGGNGANGTKPLVIRAAGPSLGALGVSGTLNDPKIEFFAGSVKTGENDNWGGSATITNAMSAVGAFAYMGPTSRDAAAAVSITNRDNSIKVSAADSGTGTVLAEIYDATPAAIFTWSTPRLVNFSVLKTLGTGLTAGFVVGGSGPKNVLVRAIGPTLTSAFGVSGAVVDPQVTLLSGQTVVASNDNWGGGAILSSAFSSVGAFALPPTSRDAAVVVSLDPGNYTVQVSGVGGLTGVVLVEIYELP